MTGNDRSQEGPPQIRLLIADVDGTLVTQHKVLTPRAIQAVHRLRDAGIAFAITSGRPPRGMTMLIEPLALTTMIPGFNGGMFVRPDMTIIEQHPLPASVAARVIETVDAHGLPAWVYRGKDWFVRKKEAPHVAREESTVQFPPTVVPSLRASWTRWSRSSRSAMTWMRSSAVSPIPRRRLPGKSRRRARSRTTWT